MLCSLITPSCPQALGLLPAPLTTKSATMYVPAVSYLHLRSACTDIGSALPGRGRCVPLASSDNCPLRNTQPSHTGLEKQGASLDQAGLSSELPAPVTCCVAGFYTPSSQSKLVRAETQRQTSSCLSSLPELAVPWGHCADPRASAHGSPYTDSP